VIHMLIAVLEKIDAKCMTLFIGKVEEEETQRNGDRLKSAETVVSKYPNGQAYAQKIKPTSDTCYVSPVLTPLQTVRYMKHTCTLTELQILAR